MAKKYSEDMLRKAHKFSYNNRAMLENDRICGCFCCLSIYSPNEIKYWVYDSANTAICPYCYDDSVIGESSGFPITREFLEAMKEYWIPWEYRWWKYWYE